MHGSSNRIKVWIERKILPAAYLGMLAGLLIRSLALVLSVSIPYATWPMGLRIAVEGLAAFGMVGCADTILALASASQASYQRQRDGIKSSDRFQANPRLPRDRYDQMQRALTLKRDLMIAGLEREIKQEWIAIAACGGVTVAYGVLFAMTVMIQAQPQFVAIEVIGVALIPFVTWYISARYREEVAEPEERAKSLALNAVDQRLQRAQERLAQGQETADDLDLLDVGTEGAEYYNRLVRALRRPGEDTYLTTPQLYAILGVTDASRQASIRRIIRRAGENHEHGVVQDAKSHAWLTPKSKVIDLLGQFIGAGDATSASRARASIARTTPVPQAASTLVFTGHGSDSERTGAVAQPMASGPLVSAV